MKTTLNTAMLWLALVGAPGFAAPGFLSLPGSGPASMDYLAFDATAKTLWIPAGARGAVYLLSTDGDPKFTTLPGFATHPNGKRVAGPSAVALGGDYAFVGNRATNEVCAFHRVTHAAAGCATLPDMPDGLAYVGSRHELWVTTPRSQSLQIVDTAKPKPEWRATVKLAGEPEGYLVDEAHGRYFTNYEDADQTVALDVQTRKVVATWPTGCGGKGPRGLRLDRASQHVLVACNAGVSVLNAAGDGAVLGHLALPMGIDEAAWDEGTRTFELASSSTGTLARVSVSEKGALTLRETLPSAKGCRSVYLDQEGTAYLPDSERAGLVVIPHRAGARTAPP